MLGLVLFTLSWVWWGNGQSFVGSLFLELGGGAFIVFLLEVLVPSALGYADTARAALQVTTLLEWSDDAVEALLTLAEADQARLLADIERGPYPVRRSWPGGVSDTGERRDGHPVLQKILPAGRTAMRYYVSDRARRRRTVVIVGLRHHRGDG